MKSQKIIRPESMVMLFFYRCPFCNEVIPVHEPIQPLTIRCPNCRNELLIEEVDERSVRYVHAMLDDGLAACYG